MRKKNILLLLFFCILAYFVIAQDGITNTDIISMKTAKISDDVIISKIITSKCNFDLTVQGLSGLYSSKIGAKIIKTMFTKTTPVEVITNDDVINMIPSKISTEIIRIKIRSTPHNFDVSPDGLIKLKAGKVPKDVVTDMMISPILKPKVKP